MNLQSLISDEALAIQRQREFPEMLRDLVDSGAEMIDITIDADTAIKLATAVELMNAMTLGDD